ncbi:AraC family transcriptional regulator [Mycobacterium intracellulare subsp. chimaera]|uniref:AraC family transcriptional regulator n=1 Tax=Mycobacterium intracellulare TaxID=1767 RepID=UPI0006863B2F|nr:AraC family transcriptional regulator [Mycobacterium intracellulare]ARV80187.1 AraC family transcriptional regulator [Mycobacterium intracellulare subsp. chimaera]ASL18828.1 AraC family transcriptional regulator [Mycobacterium intracellulare subsp. chimaera]KPN45905.1 AraC family transcriptional regulator [Mycobacterium intracellulare subsp. chimaera]KPN47813.1 AraC family transcriptional regulator [Mycobacterium intracellulare subsp. chimaera]QGK46762.1 helix-turn-helix domain-containing p
MAGTGGNQVGHGSDPLEPYFHRYSPVHTTELVVAQDMASRVFTPHRLDFFRPSRCVDTRLSAARIGAVTVGYLGYGANVALVHESAIDDYHINVPVRGHAESWCGSDSVLATPEQAAVFVPGRPAGIKWAADCVQLCVKLSRADLELQLEGLLGRPLSKPLNLAVAMNLATEASRSWLALLSVLNRELARSESIIQHPMIGRHFEQLVMDGFLLQQPAYHEIALEAKFTPALPRTVKAALDLIEDHPENYLTITDLARTVGISVRALQEGFKRHVGISPLTYLREVRLSRVHAELATASPDSATIAQTATKWGFGHLGRFSVAYRRKFGVTPHQTLRAARRSS